MRGLFHFLRSLKQHRVYRPANIALLVAVRRSGGLSPKEALKAAMAWLCRAQDVTGCGGVSAGYSFKRGWEAAYPETTGYIIETFYDYAHYAREEEFADRARTMAEWLLSIQFPGGAFQGGPVDVVPKPVVFNTGMILFGLIRAFAEHRDDRFLEAACKAGDWLAEVQDDDGAWRIYTYNGKVHTYKTRVAWALIELGQLTSNEKYLSAGTANLDWALSQQLDNGYFNHLSFDSESPYTHTIAYTIRGLLESGILLSREDYLLAAVKAAERLFRTFELTKALPGQFDSSWRPIGRYGCLTGSAQLAGIWQRIYQHTRDARYLNAALKMNDLLRAAQSLAPTKQCIDGALAGSQPVWGAYMPYYFPNWATKFFMDSLILECKLIHSLENSR